VRWIAGPSTAATAKAVAVLARAARAYKGHDDAYAKRCGESAKRGWAWLQAQDGRVKAENFGSKQPLWDDEPEFTDVGARFVAAAEMWITFRDKAALGAARDLLDEKEAQPKELTTGAWANLSRWAVAALALDDKTPAEVRNVARDRILAAAASMREQVEKGDGYRCASTPSEYYWAHNSNLLEKAHVLMVAAKLDPKAEWARQAARDQWHWVLGRNPNGYSMVTQIGKGPTRIYHMEWGNAEPPPPGYLVGGPNAQNMGFLAPGAPAKALLWDNPRKLRSGVDAHSMWHWHQSDLWDGGFVPEGDYTEGWWAVTEPDIIYNANLVLVGAGMQ
jgi:endoglucanase